ncbi:hypothetical protein C8R45DRAFT_333673 [Mycena sanguinolenta]|nr:hypothetical protein C8R45DRAFT_333673 [Mycena sanguinolenta]
MSNSDVNLKRSFVSAMVVILLSICTQGHWGFVVDTRDWAWAKICRSWFGCMKKPTSCWITESTSGTTIKGSQDKIQENPEQERPVSLEHGMQRDSD